MKRRTLLVLALLVAGCDREPAPSAEEIARRDVARRGTALEACIAEELALRARETVADLERFAPGTGPYQFAAVYRDRAELRLLAAALADSAANAGSAADSARLARRSAEFAPPRPSGGTVEANVAESYARDAARIRSTPAHPCNRSADPEGDG